MDRAGLLHDLITQWFKNRANRSGRTITFPEYTDITLAEQIWDIDEHRKFCEIVLTDAEFRKKSSIKDLFLRDRHLSVMRAVIMTLREARHQEITARWIEEYQAYHCQS